jgi:hypothetical protein
VIKLAQGLVGAGLVVAGAAVLFGLGGALLAAGVLVLLDRITD